MAESPDRPIFVIGSLVAACCARVPRCPEPGESLRATDFFLEPGGKGFNVALAAHRLGVPVDGLFAVGDDAAGTFMRSTFARLGLAGGMIETVDMPTGAGVGLIQSDGENRIAVFPGANEALAARHVLARSDRLRGAGLVYAQFEASDAPIATAFALARQHAIRTMLNPSPYRPVHADILAATDMIVVNENEARALAGEWGLPDALDDLAADLAQRGVPTLVVTRGQHGALAWQDGERLEQPAFVVNAIDTIGAGDAFIGGVLAALAHGHDFATALTWGCAAGALVATRLGLVDALPDRKALHAMIESGTV